MNACKRSILGYQVSDTRATRPCILTMQWPLIHLKTFLEKL